MPGSGSIATFSSGTGNDPNIGANYDIGRINFSTGVDSEAFTGAGTLTLFGISGIGISNTSTQSHSFANLFAINSSQTWQSTGSGAGSLQFNNDITIGANTLTFNVGASNTIAVSTGAGDVIAGTGGSLVKDGTGTLTFGNVANTFDSGFTLNAGTVTIGNNASLGTGTVTLAGGTLHATADRTLANNLSVTGAATISAASGVDYRFTSDNISGTGTLTFDNSSNSGIATLRFDGSGFDLQSDLVFNDDAGETELRFRNSTGGTQTFSGDISGNVDLARLSGVSGAGTTILSGNNTYTGGTTLTSGTIAAGSDTALGSGAITFGGGTIASSGGAHTLANALTITAGPNVGGTEDLTLTGNGTLTANRTFTIDNTGTTTFSGVLSQSGGTRALIKAGDGEMVLGGTSANTYTGNTRVNAGTLVLDKTDSVDAVAGNAVVNSGGTLRLGSNEQVAGSASLTVNGGGFFDLDGYTETVSALAGAGTVDFGTGGDLIVSQGVDTIFSGSFAGDATSTFTKSGAGVLELTNTFSFDGTFYLGGGTLRLTDMTLNLGSLVLTGNSTIDFAGTSSHLNLNYFDAAGFNLTILGWNDVSDTFITNSWNGAVQNVRNDSPMNQVDFSGWGGASNTQWQGYDNQITPVPEPTTWGAIFLAVSTAGIAWRRRRR